MALAEALTTESRRARDPIAATTHLEIENLCPFSIPMPQRTTLRRPEPTLLLQWLGALPFFLGFNNQDDFSDDKNSGAA